MYLKKGIYKTDNLDVRSFKMYGDGALGSRGACLHKSYSDMQSNMGHYCSYCGTESVAQQIANSEFQLNSHAIGDSANTVLLKIYKEALTGKKDRRWKLNMRKFYVSRILNI
jgi:predicted amidohydrolase YtcJ